jgi:hypothetical protein
LFARNVALIGSDPVQRGRANVHLKREFPR